MNPVGYLINTRAGLTGEQGMFYDYILAENGIFIQAQSPLLVARIPVAITEVRGLAPVDRKVKLVHGGIRPSLYELALSTLAANRWIESYVAITWENGEYRLRKPWQVGKDYRVTYEVLPNTVLELHSHGPLKGRHSIVDDEDEQGFKLSAVVGQLDTLLPNVDIRITVYGYFAPVSIDEVFYVCT